MTKHQFILEHARRIKSSLKYAAMDKDRQWHFYEEKPRISLMFEEWVIDEKQVKRKGFLLDGTGVTAFYCKFMDFWPDVIDWIESLVDLHELREKEYSKIHPAMDYDRNTNRYQALEIQP